MLLVGIAACAQAPEPGPGEEALRGVEPGTPRGEVLRALGPGPLEEGAVATWSIDYGYRTGRYLAQGETWEILWVTEDGFTPADSTSMELQTPVLLRNGAMEGWGWTYLRDTWVDQGLALPEWIVVGARHGAEEGRELFWTRLRALCGSTFEGGLVRRRPADEFLIGSERLLLQVRDCSDEEVRMALHIERPDEERERSRSWIVRRIEGGNLELYHDIRLESGAESPLGGFGGVTESTGTAERQSFRFRDGLTPEWFDRGWRLELIPGVRLDYTTYQGPDVTWGVQFDLSRPQPAPPPHWGDL